MLVVVTSYFIQFKYIQIITIKLMKQLLSVKWTRPDEPATLSLYLKMLHKALFKWSLVWCLPKSL